MSALMESLITFQEMLLDITVEKVLVITKQIEDFVRQGDQQLVSYVAASLWQACHARPQNSDLLFQVIQACNNPAFRDAVTAPERINKRHFRLVLSLFTSGYIDKDQLSKMANGRMFHFYFAPELGYTVDESRSNFSYLGYQWSASGRGYAPHLTLDELGADDWKLHKELRDEGNQPGDLARAIQTDNIEDFVELYTKQRKAPASPVPYGLYDIIDLEGFDLRLADYACLYQATKVVKFLLTNNALVSDKTLMCAVISGNAEILRLLSENGASFTASTLCLTISYQLFDMFGWMIDEKKVFLPELNDSFIPMVFVDFILNHPDVRDSVKTALKKQFEWVLEKE